MVNEVGAAIVFFVLAYKIILKSICYMTLKKSRYIQYTIF